MLNSKSNKITDILISYKSCKTNKNIYYCQSNHNWGTFQEQLN